MTPKIIFRYSKIYDGLRKRRKKKIKYPSERQILNYIKKLEKLWKKEENKLLKEISKVHELEWKEKYIYCYIVTEGVSLSDPLTLSICKKGIFKKLDSSIDVLTHELIHTIITPGENWQKFKKASEYIHWKYKNETERTKIHIRIHAIHNHIFLKFYNKERLEREIRKLTHKKDYKRAWQIVQKEGYQNIINEFVKRIQK